MFAAKTCQFLYCLRQSWQNIKEGRLSTCLTILSIACSLLLLCLYLIISSNLSVALDLTETQRIVLYLRDSLSSEKIPVLQQEFSHCPEVLAVQYVSKEKALEKFGRQLGEDAVLLEGLPTNPLPASLELSLKLDKPERLKGFCQGLAARPEIESVQGGIEWIERLSALLAIVRLLVFALGAILMVISVFITASTIHLAIARRRDEIATMRLVGATEWYIRLPFFLEGLLDGLLAGCVAVSVTIMLYYLFCWQISPFVRMVFGISHLAFLGSREISLILLTGTLMGGGGSAWSFFIPFPYLGR